MTGIATRQRGAPEIGTDVDMTIQLSVSRLTRRLSRILALLAAVIALVLASTAGQPVVQFLFGSTVTVSAAMEGAGCGSHLEWATRSKSIQPGTTVHFENSTVYWQIPIVIEKLNADGTATVVARSLPIRDGERWSHTFWRAGDYRVVSGQEVQQLAGLDMTLQVAR